MRREYPTAVENCLRLRCRLVRFYRLSKRPLLHCLPPELALERPIQLDLEHETFSQSTAVPHILQYRRIVGDTDHLGYSFQKLSHFSTPFIPLRWFV